VHFKKTNDYMVRALKNIDDVNREIDWGLGKENPNILEHLQFLIQHEILHHGQLVAFAYLFSLPIPESMVNTWAFTLNETQKTRLKKSAS
jgi:Mg2+/Co2+ transporter CorB